MPVPTQMNLKWMVQWFMTVHLFPHVLRPMEHLEKYDYFLRSNADVPEHIVQSLWNLKMYTATVFEKGARQTPLDKYFKQK
jgi:hypothetical protein